MQNFKGDESELKFISSASPLLTIIGSDLNEMHENCYDCYLLGDAIYDAGAAPLTNAIIQTVFREAFNEIFKNFAVAGTFESYIAVFTKIFGENVEIDFTIPAEGKLFIDITADQVELSNFVARYIEDNAYIFDNVVTEIDDQIVFQTIKGFQTEAELNNMLTEMVPAGIYTEISLTLLT